MKPWHSGHICGNLLRCWVENHDDAGEVIIPKWAVRYWERFRSQEKVAPTKS